MKNRRNYYRLLQVQPDAPIEIIRTSYRTLMRELKQHPDLGGDHGKASMLNEAYAILSDSVKRTEYDKELFQKYTKKILPQKKPNLKNTTNRSFDHSKSPTGYTTGGDSYSASESFTASRTENKSSQPRRRKVRRMKKYEDVRYCSTSHHLEGVAQMLDVSTDGVRFVCSQKLNENLILRLISSLFKAEVKVISSQKCILHGKTKYNVGAQFISVTFRNPRGSFISNIV
jgi:DnaJ-class molecular chaperone